MDAKLLHSHSLGGTPLSHATTTTTTTMALLQKSWTTSCPYHIFSPPVHRRRRPIKLTTTFNKTTTTTTTSSDGTDDVDGDSGLRPPTTPPDTFELRFRRRSRRRSRRQREDGDGDGRRFGKAQASVPAPPVKKEWEDMSVAEKAMELYMGEKGLLFWLNKFAYASIFILIGAWILFRFVGPALDLYQLDSAPQSPASMFKGS